MEEQDSFRLLFIGLLLAASALFSGLTLGLMSLSEYELKRKMDLGDPLAKKVYPLRRKGNQLLVTLLLGNVLVNAALTVMLNSFLTGLLAISISTAMITIFGEIFPQALLKKHGLRFGASVQPALSSVMWLMWPVSYPLGRLIDKMIGEEDPTVYSRQELVKIFEEHQKNSGSDIEEDELRLVSGALKIGHKRVAQIMTPRSVVVSLEPDTRMTRAALKHLYESGLSRFPVIDNDQVIGMLYIRDLVTIDDGDPPLASEVMSKKVMFVDQRQPLDHVLNSFIRTKQHLFIVTNEFKETVGVISIEDIVEEIIGKEIIDEFDQHTDMRAQAKFQAGDPQLSSVANTKP